MRYYSVIGWTSYDDEQYPMITDGNELINLRATIVHEIREKGYQFSGLSHYYKSNCTPVLNSGEKLCLPYREWAALMAQAWNEDNSDGKGYLSWCDDRFDRYGKAHNPEKRCKYPCPGVCTEKIVKKDELQCDPSLKIYTGPRWLAAFFASNGTVYYDPPENFGGGR